MTTEQRTKKAEQLRIAAQIIETGCEWDYKVPDGRIEFHPSEHETDSSRLGFCIQHGYEIHIKEPEIPVPEGYRELREYEKDGRWIEGAKWLNDKCEWIFSCVTDGGAYACKWKRIIVPLPKPRVPLEPGDVPPGSVVRAKGCDRFESDAQGEWAAVLNVDVEKGICIFTAGLDFTWFSWVELMTSEEIKRPTDTEWQPASKPAP